jgi:AmmeMemoRadiSam system radical SAM enzyme
MPMTDLLNYPNVHEAAIYRTLPNRKVECGTCERRCVIAENQIGFCKTRQNIDGRLYTLVYGDISSSSANPIEKKPFFHFWPGSYALTIGTWSCNFTCPWCVDPSTMVLLDDGTEMPISHLENCWTHHNLIVCNWNRKEIHVSPIAKYIKLNPLMHGLKVYRVVTKETGREIIATEDHPFYSKKGVVPLRELKKGDKVAVYPTKAVRFKKTRDKIIVTEEDLTKIALMLIPRTNLSRLLSDLRSRELLPLTFKNKKFLILARLLGHLFGDGYLTLSLRKIRDAVDTVFTGKSEDLSDIQNDLKNLGFRPSKIVIRERRSKVFRYGKTHAIIGKSMWVSCQSKALWTLFKALGAPIGDKATATYNVPEWLYKAPIQIKREFLAAFFGGKLDKPRPHVLGKNFFQPKFSLNKTEELLTNGLKFVQDLKRLLNDFDVTISRVRSIPGSVRKDGTKTICIYVLFSNKLENLLNLYGRIGYRYNKERSRLAHYAYEYLLMKKWELKKRRMAFKRAETLKRRGVSPSIIYHRLKEAVDYSVLLSWLKGSIKVGRIRLPESFPKFDVWKQNATEDLGNSGLVWETIEKIEIKHTTTDVRDLTLKDAAHNFFANGFLVSNCQNFDISKFPPNPRQATYISPEKLIDITLREKCQGTSISFNEPTLLFEYSLDVFRLAHLKNLYNTYVSNGYLTLEALRTLGNAGLDAIKFDVKGDKETYQKYCAADVSVVWRNIAEAKRLGLHVEIVTLVIPGVNDDEDCIREIVQNHLKTAGPQTPLHFTQYYPAYKFSAPRTPVKTLENAYEIAKREGVQYVYVGNVPGHKWENTYCHNCGELLIERYIFSVIRYRLTLGNRCPKCGVEIPIIGEYVKSPYG